LSNPEKRIPLIKAFRNHVKDIPIENIISIDETSIDTHIENNKGWSKRGVKLTSIKTYKRIRYTVISSVGFNKVIHNEIIKGSCNGDIFLDFIKGVIKKLPKTTNWGFILDNARIHHYKKLKEYLNKVDNVKIIYNVPYSPESNPIEKVFNEIKNTLKNIPINEGNIIKEINRSFLCIKKENLNNYFKKSINFYK